MTTVGPVCHIPPANPSTPQPSPKDIPAIPPPAQATLQSLQSTVNQLRQIIIQLTGQQGPPGAPGANAKSTPPGSFVQAKIVTKTVRIFQNNDPTSQNWVDVERVNSLVMNNNSTKATWTYTRPPDPGGS